MIAHHFDPNAIRAHVEMLHDLAAGYDGIIPLCIYGENPDSGRKTTIVQHFRVGDVDGMTAAALAYENHPDANVYAPLAVMRQDLPRREKGGENDVIAALGVVIDDDADAGRSASPPIAANYVLETSKLPAPNRQQFILFDQPLSVWDAKPILDALYNASGGDHGTKDASHVWRIPGTANWPNAKKVRERNRPREPQPVRIIKPWDGSLTKVEELRRVLAPHMNGAKPNGHARADDTEADCHFLWATLPEAVKKLIVSPPMPNEDRSATAATVILSLIGRGWSDDRIAAVIAAHPQGIGARYAEGNNLGADIERLRKKSKAKPSNAAPDDFSADPAQIFDPWEQYVVPPFPFDVLPNDVRRFIETQSKVIGCDPSAMAMATLASLSGAIDHRFALKMLRNGDWYAHPRLWVLMVGDPSRKKSPAIRAATKCLDDHEQALWDKWEREREALKPEDPEADDPPKPPRFVVGDTTIEALGEILTRGDRGLLVKRDEIAGWIGGMERYNSGNRGASADRAFWLQAYDGGPFTVDRIKRGEQRIKNLSVSLLGGIQPERLQELRGLTSDGLLQRFLPVMMTAACFPVDVPTGPASEAYRKLTLTLVNARYATVIMTDEALAAMADARRKLHDLEQVCGGVAQGFQAFVGKLHGILGTMALILHIIHDPLDGNTGKVEATTVKNAAKLVDQFILPHAFEFDRTAENATEGDRLQKVASYILTSGKDRIVASDLTANVALCRGLTLWDVNQRVSPLIAGGWLTPEEKGPVSKAWTVNPAVLEQLREQAEIEERRKSELAAIMASPRKRATRVSHQIYQETWQS